MKKESTSAKSKFDPTAARKRWILYALSTAAVSWVGLWGILQMPVNPTTVAVLFILLFAAVTSTILPALAYLNARFGQFHDARTYRVRFARQSVWIGFLVTIGAWLQMNRLLNLTLALILLAVFALTETFLVTRESPSEES